METKNNNVPTTFNGQAFEQLILKGDLSSLDTKSKIQYYNEYCKRLGLDPLTLPFKILRTDGKETLYCDRSGTQQLSKINHVSHEIVSRDTINGCFIVIAKALTPDGRKSESIGAVSVEKENGEWKDTQNGKRFFQGNGTFTQLKGEALCNAMMKAETKAKRRATLDLLGIGVLDESEIESIPTATTISLDIKPEVKNTEPVATVISESPIHKEYMKMIEETGLLTAEQKDRYTKDYLTWSNTKVEKAIAKLKLTLADIEKSIEAQKNVA